MFGVTMNLDGFLYSITTLEEFVWLLSDISDENITLSLEPQHNIVVKIHTDVAFLTKGQRIFLDVKESIMRIILKNESR
jgi:hypothetical protein